MNGLDQLFSANNLRFRLYLACVKPIQQTKGKGHWSCSFRMERMVNKHKTNKFIYVGGPINASI